MKDSEVCTKVETSRGEFAGSADVDFILRRKKTPEATFDSPRALLQVTCLASLFLKPLNCKAIWLALLIDFLVSNHLSSGIHQPKVIQGFESKGYTGGTDKLLDKMIGNLNNQV